MSEQTARQLLIDWANLEQNWVRAIVREVLATRQPLSEDAAEEIYERCLVERDLRDGTVSKVSSLSIGDEGEETIEKLLLKEIREVKNVNRLAADQVIRFNPYLTVLFGENATGKSGYVRILKRVAAVRSAEDILPDIRAGQVSGPPTATLEYRLGTIDSQLNWAGESGTRPFTRMSIFDTRAMSFHIDDDLTYVYTPRDLALFQYVHQGIKGMSDRLEAARDEARAGANPFLSRFQQGSSVFPKVESLSAATDVAQLEALADVPEGEKTQLETLRDMVEALKPGVVQSRLELAQNDRDLYDAVLSTAKSVRGVDWGAYNESAEKARVADQRYLIATQTAFAGSDIPGVLADAWRDLIAAGEAYLDDLGRPDYPQADDKCIYCRQDLGQTALELVRKYRHYSNNSLKVALDEARAQVRTAGTGVSDVEPPPLLERLEKKISTAPAGAPALEVVNRAIGFLEALAAVVDPVRAGQCTEPGDLASRAVDLCNLAHNERQETDALVASLQKQGEDREREFGEQSAKLRDLEDRLALRAILPQVRTHVENARWAQRTDTIIRERFPPLLRSLTAQSKVASEDLLNQDFERIFRQECEALRAPEVRLEFPGRHGEAARRKSLVADHRLSEVLSEGEQNVIALADFLAEAAIRGASSPILFDDPVSSLDYRRLEYIVDRLCQLSTEDQVIVFTHNIWFATALLSKFEKSPADCSYFNVELAENGLAGIITGGNHPRWDTPAKLRPRINELIQGAEKVTGEPQQALIESAYSRLRSWCEVVTEHDLLAGVSQRYRPNVMMTKLLDVRVDRLAAAIDVISRVFEKACRVTDAHSQPLETLGSQPTLQDLKDDWKEAQEARSAYLDNR